MNAVLYNNLHPANYESVTLPCVGVISFFSERIQLSVKNYNSFFNRYYAGSDRAQISKHLQSSISFSPTNWKLQYFLKAVYRRKLLNRTMDAQPTLNIPETLTRLSGRWGENFKIEILHSSLKPQNQLALNFSADSSVLIYKLKVSKCDSVKLLKETRNKFKKWPLNLCGISNKTITEIGNVTKAANFKNLSYLNF